MKTFIVFWIICGVLAYGITFGHFHRNHPSIAEKNYRQNMSFSVGIGLIGPIGLIVIFFHSGFAEHGLKFK